MKQIMCFHIVKQRLKQRVKSFNPLTILQIRYNHIFLEGEEMIGWKALEDLQNETKAYSKEEDCALYSDQT